uniref:mRNA interferase RelE/StbE n=1 Tax=Candidatus Kentrum sp. TC TaxID=2126339 RepID=A0A450YZH8_9GAMM|nr:MAG: mRNA interferase RelE/StbE [Candidatus Kentron sp. TC]
MWTVEFDDTAAKELRELDRQAQGDILRYFRNRVATNETPRRLGRSPSGDLADLWRYRIRDYRMICNIEDEKRIVLVVRVAHRKDVYQ